MNPPSPGASTGEQSPVGIPPVLAVENLTVRLGGRDVLRGVNFSMAPGQFTGLIGSNGAGKTTLLRAILGLVRPVSGSVALERRFGRRQGVGYVPQRVVLEPDLPMRSRDLVGLGVDGHRFGIPLPSKSRRAIVDEMLDLVDAKHLAKSRVGALSGGEQQRVLIAHALAGKPKLLLLDEPLANLDLGSERKVVEVLDRLARENNIGVLISTHDMNPLLPVMDSIVYIANGRAAGGSVGEVVTTEALTRLYGHHVDVLRVHDRVIVVAGREGSIFDHTGQEPVTSIL